MRKLNTLLLALLSVSGVYAQKGLNYYLPQGEQYDSAIPTPKAIIGHEVGEWHVNHDKLVQYMYALAASSDRVTVAEQARTYENRPTLLLTITSPENQGNIEIIRKNHLQLCDPRKSANLNTTDMPIVVWLGYSVHGNEASGSNASLVVAYHLAAAKGAAMQALLKNTVILLDPSFNPDGLNRFASWVNTHKSKNLVTDPNSRELIEPWPRGRTNHYWFDLNRDWLAVQLPESQGRIHSFQQWRPNILTDHHEMGSDATFFFQPGIPSRRNPLTPAKNVELTEKIAAFHAKALDNIGSLYYTKERFDDFYYGKGSTYPDAQGAVGILFEQASVRGHSRKTVHGIIDFPFAIKNQVTTSMSTLAAAQALRQEMLNYQRSFYQASVRDAATDRLKAYAFGEKYDKARLFHLLKILRTHKIKVYRAARSLSIKARNYAKEDAYIIPLAQEQYRLVKGIFGTQTTFKDSLFYDVSTWTLPLSFGIPYTEIKSKDFTSAMLGEAIDTADFPTGKCIGGTGALAYAFDWNTYFAPRALYRLQKAGVKTKVATKKMTATVASVRKTFDYGAISIPLGIQKVSKEKIEGLLNTIAEEEGIHIYALNTGLATEGVDLGSGSLNMLKKPQIMLFIGDGVNSYEAGEVWHLLDQRYGIPVSQITINTFNAINPSQYNVIIMVQGDYKKVHTAKIKSWVQQGGTLILTKSAVKWGAKAELTDLEFRKAPQTDSTKIRPYARLEPDLGKHRIGGSIFEASIDKTHPLGYGYTSDKIALFRNSTIFVKKRKNPYACPIIYTDKPLLSGYISAENKKLIPKTVSVSVNALGKGRIISMADNPNFRAFWYGTNKIFANAIFFGQVISEQSAK